MTNSTLEKIAKGMGDKFDEERIHSGLLLAHAQTVYDVMRRTTVPTPLYRITYDDANVNIDLRECDGKSLVPMSNALDIDALDVVMVGSLRGMPVLFEGETGTGKTYVSNGFLNTVFPKDSTFSLRMSGGMYESIQRPFLKGSRDAGGMPKSVVDQDIIDRTAGMLIDEPNRGDPDELLQLLDNSIFHDGQYYKLGLQIPEICKDGTVKDSGARKKVDITSAINPANAKYSGTVELDAAVDNRFLRLPYGNSSTSAGSTLWLSDKGVKNFEVFMKKFPERASKNIGVSEEAFSDLRKDWLSTYAYITDPSRTDKSTLYSGIELSDYMIHIMSGNLPGSFEYEKETANSWNAKLNAGLETKEKLTDTVGVKNIQNLVDTFKVPIIFRDVDQIKKLSDVVTTLENLREAFADKDPVKSYMKMPKYISAKEVAMGSLLLARNKQKQGSALPTGIINEVLTNYTSLAGQYQKDLQDMKGDKFYADDPNGGIKKLAIVKGIRKTVGAKGGSDMFIKELVDNTKILKGYMTATGDVKNSLVMRGVADLMTLAGFVKQYESDIDPIFKNYIRKTSVTKVVDDIGKVYYDKRENQGMILPEIYQHRIQRTLGV
jgi:hypothetical protein